MAFAFTALAFDYGPENAMERLIFMSLCDRADSDTFVCWPSRADLQERTRLSNTTISKYLRKLEKAGWITRRKRFNSSSVYRVNVPRLRTREAERLAVRTRPTPEGFEPFAEEIAEKTDVQTIENKGNDATRHTDAASRHTDAAKRHLNLSKNLSKNLASLSDLKKDQIRKGSSFVHDGMLVTGAHLANLARQLRALEKRQGEKG